MRRMQTLTGWGRSGAKAVLLAILSAFFSFISITGSFASEPQILGRVIDLDGEVVAGAIVFLTPVNGSGGPRNSLTHTLRSDQAGAFHAALPAGRYRVAALKSGYDVTMTDIHSRPRGILMLQMTRATGLFPNGRLHEPAAEDLDSGWILRQQRDNVLRTAGPDLGDATAPREEARPVSTAGFGEWAAALFAPIDGRFVQQFSGGASFADDGEASYGRTTGLSLKGALADESHWRFNGWAGRSFAEVDDQNGHLDDQNDRAAIGFDYRLADGDKVAGDLWYGSRHFMVETGDGTGNGTEQKQRTIALRSRWERQVDGGAALFVEGEYFETEAQLQNVRQADGRIENRHLLAATGLALHSGDHSIDLGLVTEQYDYELWDEGVSLYGNEITPSSGIDTGSGPAFSLNAADRWRTGALTEVSYGLRYHNQPQSGASWVVPRVGVTLTPPGVSGVVVRSEVLYRFDDQHGAAAPGEELGGADEGEKLGYLIGIERRPRSSDDRLHLAASYSFSPFAAGWPAGGNTGSNVTAGGTPLILGDGSTSAHEVEVEMAQSFGLFRGGLAGKVGLAEGRLTPAMNEAPVQIMTEGEAHYYQTQLWATCAQTNTEVQVDYRHVHAEETLAASGAEPSDYRRLDFVVYQQIPGPRTLGDARLRVLMAYQGFAYDSLYDGPDGATVSGRASRLTGGLDISF